MALDAGNEGSYGVTSAGIERNVGTSTCLLQQTTFAHCLEDNFVDASLDRVARLDAVMNAVATIIEAGGSYTDVADNQSANSQRDRIYSWDGPFTVEIVPVQLP